MAQADQLVPEYWSGRVFGKEVHLEADSPTTFVLTVKTKDVRVFRFEPVILGDRLCHEVMDEGATAAANVSELIYWGIGGFKTKFLERCAETMRAKARELNKAECDVVRAKVRAEISGDLMFASLEASIARFIKDAYKGGRVDAARSD